MPTLFKFAYNGYLIPWIRVFWCQFSYRCSWPKSNRYPSWFESRVSIKRTQSFTLWH